jgi:uncharacterized protein (DUF58 family)
MSLFFQGEPRRKRPERVDDLIDNALMARIGQLDVVSRKIFSGKIQGERRSKRRGQSVEFADFRPYVHGDDLRFVDWNIFGRLDKLFLKMFLEEEDLSLVIALDTSASMRAGNPDAFDYARRVAMALAYVGLTNQHRVSLVGFSQGRIDRASNLRGRRKAADVAQWLLAREPEGASGFGEEPSAGSCHPWFWCTAFWIPPRCSKSCGSRSAIAGAIY